MTLPAHRVLLLILFTSAVFMLCVCQGIKNFCHLNFADCHQLGVHNGTPASIYCTTQCFRRISFCFAVPFFSVTTVQCVAPTLDDFTIAVSKTFVYIYSMSPFTSSCNGRVVGYWFCYQNTGSTTGERVNISTVLLLEDMGADYNTIVRRFTVKTIPGRDCPSGGQCCVSRNLSAENHFRVNSSYLYGVVDLQVHPNMDQTHVSVGRPGYLFTTSVYEHSGDILSRSDDPTVQPLKIFQFIIGELRFTFVAHLWIN